MKSGERRRLFKQYEMELKQSMQDNNLRKEEEIDIAALTALKRRMQAQRKKNGSI